MERFKLDLAFLGTFHQEIIALWENVEKNRHRFAKDLSPEEQALADQLSAAHVAARLFKQGCVLI